MERFKIPMLSRLDTISHIMPYYSHTHKAFLLLSSLSLASRRKLDEFYDEFVNHMKEYWLFIKAEKWNKWSHLFLPNDLFEISIHCWDKENTQPLIIFIENLIVSKGWYFRNHYMHSKIKIWDPIKIDINCIKELYPYIDILKSTQVVLCKRDSHCSNVKYESSTLNTNSSHTLFKLKRTYISIMLIILLLCFTRRLKFFIFILTLSTVPFYKCIIQINCFKNILQLQEIF